MLLAADGEDCQLLPSFPVDPGAGPPGFVEAGLGNAARLANGPSYLLISSAPSAARSCRMARSRFVPGEHDHESFLLK
jgi:hypothetical protein